MAASAIAPPAPQPPPPVPPQPQPLATTSNMSSVDSAKIQRLRVEGERTVEWLRARAAGEPPFAPRVPGRLLKEDTLRALRSSPISRITASVLLVTVTAVALSLRLLR
eukprot:scaffold169397_cov30-Tisochrysis_lutea.AAC.1